MSSCGHNVKDRLHEIDERVMGELTPFQRATVEHIEKVYRGTQRRVLVADEVGLGKTLIARGVISKIACMRSEEGDDLVKIAYVCSNASIAAQNIEKLSIDGDIKLAPSDTSRLSMQHLNLARERGDEDLLGRYIQITPLTPDTSFSITSGAGTMYERALMRAVLCYDERFGSDAERRGELKRLLWARQANYNEGRWNWLCRRACTEVREARMSARAHDESCRYPYDVLEKVACELTASGTETLETICSYIDGVERSKRREYGIIIALRRAFSKACVDMLDSDFVIMDEFQRFRSLITNTDTEAALLARRFLSGNTRVLLLSATPFRLFSTDAELDSTGFGDSYQEFLEVMGFLGGQDKASRAKFLQAWGSYTVSLRSLGTASCDVISIRSAKGEAEDLARNYMVRTERQSTGELGPIADNTSHVQRLEVTPKDVKAYVYMRRLVRSAGINKGLMSQEFVKSCPFPLSFMSGYKLFKELESKVAHKPSLVSANKRADGGLLWLRRWDVASYDRLSVGNARYRALMRDLAGDELVHAEQLLWIPASKPYYTPSANSPYARAQGFSKMILFSSWAMVPLSLSCILSYEFERKNVLKLQQITGRTYRYFKDEEGGADERGDAQALPYRRLRFDKDQRGAFLLLYPSRYLAGLVDVVDLASREVSLSELRREVRKNIERDLADALGIRRLPRNAEAGQRVTADWYAMAAMRLDAAYGYDPLGEILDDEGRAALGFDEHYKTEERALWGVWQDASTFEYGDLSRLPADAVDVLADAAIASPAVCALRTYGAYCEDVPAWMAFQVGSSFVARMNTASATLAVAAVMEKQGTTSVHWKNMLAYACEGNLQAVLDEYAYLRRPMAMDFQSQEAVLRMHRSMVGDGSEPDFRNVEARHWAYVANHGRSPERIGRMSMRTNIAEAFMESKSRKSGDGAVTRSNLREAFNSPFRPFVLVSTSVGQEGLDFHRYCRKICHWNLPSNPIDLEQREGRVNRYQGLSVRQSVAGRYGRRSFGPGPIWRQLFDAAEREEMGGQGEAARSGLLPNWGVGAGSVDPVPVERYVYLYPFSRDEARYRELVEQVIRYRAVLGQPDQEQLLQLLDERVEEGVLSKEDMRSLYLNLCPFEWRRQEG